LSISGHDADFAEWDAIRQQRSGVNFERSCTIFIADGKRFSVPVSTNNNIETTLSLDLNLYCQFKIVEGDGEFQITRSVRPKLPADWAVDLRCAELVRQVEPGITAIYRHPASVHLIVVKSFDDEESFNCQVDALSALNHPCIVPMFGCAPAGRRIATYFMGGGSLADVIRLKSSPAWWTATAKSIVIVGVVLGMAEMHRNNIAHGNLKASTIVFDDRHRPRIAGFSASRRLSIEDVNKTDVFAFGLIVFEIVTGRVVVTWGLNEAQMRRKVQEMDLPEGAKSLIAMCWTEEFAARPSFAQIYEELRKRKFSIGEADSDPDEVVEFINWVRKCDWARPTAPLLALGRGATGMRSPVQSTSVLGRIISPRQPPIVSPITRGRARGRRRRGN
jgi:serine/threonine protein kinase